MQIFDVPIQCLRRVGVAEKFFWFFCFPRTSTRRTNRLVSFVHVTYFLRQTVGPCPHRSCCFAAHRDRGAVKPWRESSSDEHRDCPRGPRPPCPTRSALLQGWPNDPLCAIPERNQKHLGDCECDCQPSSVVPLVKTRRRPCEPFQTSGYRLTRTVETWTPARLKHLVPSFTSICR